MRACVYVSVYVCSGTCVHVVEHVGVWVGCAGVYKSVFAPEARVVFTTHPTCRVSSCFSSSYPRIPVSFVPTKLPLGKWTKGTG